MPVPVHAQRLVQPLHELVGVVRNLHRLCLRLDGHRLLRHRVRRAGTAHVRAGADGEDEERDLLPLGAPDEGVRYVLNQSSSFLIFAF